MSEKRAAHDVIADLRADLKSLGRFAGGKPEMTNTDLRNYILELIDIVEQLDSRISVLEGLD